MGLVESCVPSDLYALTVIVSEGITISGSPSPSRSPRPMFALYIPQAELSSPAFSLGQPWRISPVCSSTHVFVLLPAARPTIISKKPLPSRSPTDRLRNSCPPGFFHGHPRDLKYPSLLRTDTHPPPWAVTISSSPS